MTTETHRIYDGANVEITLEALAMEERYRLQKNLLKLGTQENSQAIANPVQHNVE
jgi:hypothetical protein